MSTKRQAVQNIAGRGRWYWQAGIFLGLLFLCLFFFWFRQSPARVEGYYSNGFYPLIASVQQLLWGWVPFSVGDVFYVLIVCSLLCLLWQSVRKFFRRRWGDGLFGIATLVNTILGLFVFFQLSWGLNYYRQPLSVALEIGDVKPVFADFLETTIHCIDSANALRAQLSDADFERSNREVFDEAGRLMLREWELSDALFVSRPRAKSPLLNAVGNYMGVSGYFNPFSHEAHVNTAMPMHSRPFTTCHELAHQAGIGFEDEANFVGYLLASGSDDKLFRYSGYYAAMIILLRDIYFHDIRLYEEFRSRISPSVLFDAEKNNAFWAKYMGHIQNISSTVYTSYLEANNQPEGLERYNRMVQLLVAWNIRDLDCR